MIGLCLESFCKVLDEGWKAKGLYRDKRKWYHCLVFSFVTVGNKDVIKLF